MKSPQNIQNQIISMHAKNNCSIPYCNCHESISKIIEIQRIMVENKLQDIFDSTISSRLFSMKDIGITTPNDFYQEAKTFFETCFQSAIDKYFKND